MHYQCYQRVGLVFWVLLGIITSESGVIAAEQAKEAAGSPEAALRRLEEGNHRFVADQMAPREPLAQRRARLASGQRPFAVILACADSRVVPELIFDQQLGDLFVVRLAGNVTDPAVLGSIEYAVEHLHPTLAVVLGHTRCGAVQAAVAGGDQEGNLGELIERVRVGADLPRDERRAVENGVRVNTLHQTRNLTSQSEVLRDFVASGRLRIVAGVYSLETGRVGWLDVAANGGSKDP